MDRASCLLTIAAVLAIAAPASADGLIYRLPEDGTSAKFELNIAQTVNGKQGTSKGELSIASVGKATVDEEPCRWIEFKSVLKFGKTEQTVISKALIAERSLAEGQTPGEHMIRGWTKFGGRKPEAVTDPMRLALPIPILASPGKDLRGLEAIEIEGKLGRLNCRGAAGKLTFDVSNAPRFIFHYENRLHDSAPFGVVSAVWKSEVSSEGEVQATGTTTLTLIDVGAGAVSELPDNN